MEYLLELRASGQRKCSPYADKYPEAQFIPDKKPWEVPAEIYMPCATQNEINLDDAKMMVENGVKYICEASNMPCTNEATQYF